MRNRRIPDPARSLKLAPVATLAVALLHSTAVCAQAYPSKPIRTVMSVAGGSEIFVRVAASILSPRLGVPVLVETQAGAGGSVGALTVARAAPDGYTILFGTTSAMVLRQFVVKDMPYELLKDFTPVMQLGNATGAIVAHRDVPANTLKDLIDYAKANPGKISYGSTGSGTTHHLSGVIIAQLTGADLLHVPYKGAPPAVTDLVAGRIQLAFSTTSAFAPMLQAGKIKLLAINEDRRLPQYPDTPTVFEVVPGYDRLASWFGYFGPAGLPQPIVRRLSGELEKAAQEPELIDKITATGSLVNVLPPEPFASELKKQLETAGRLMKAAGIRPE